MKRIVLLAFALLALASCGSSGVVVLPKSDLNRMASDLYGTGVRNKSQGATTVRLYMVEGTRLAAVDRTGTSSLPVAETVMRELLKGPTRAEFAKGLTTQIPEAVRLLRVSVDDRGTASVDLSADYEVATPDRTTFLLRLAQVVWTLAELDNVDSVRFLIEGQQVSVLVQDNQLISEAVGKGRYSDFAPRSAGAPVSQGPLAG